MLYSGGGAGASRQSASISTPKTKTLDELIAEIDEKIKVKEADRDVEKTYFSQNNRKDTLTHFKRYKILHNEVNLLKTSRANLTRMQESVQSVTKTANEFEELRRRVASQKVASQKREGGKKMRRSRKQSITKRKTRKGAYIRSLLYSGGGAGASTGILPEAQDNMRVDAAEQRRRDAHDARARQVREANISGQPSTSNAGMQEVMEQERQDLAMAIASSHRQFQDDALTRQDMEEALRLSLVYDANTAEEQQQIDIALLLSRLEEDERKKRIYDDVFTHRVAPHEPHEPIAHGDIAVTFGDEGSSSTDVRRGKSSLARGVGKKIRRSRKMRKSKRRRRRKTRRRH